MFFLGERRLHQLIAAVPGGLGALPLPFVSPWVPGCPPITLGCHEPLLPLALGLSPTSAGPSHPDSSMQLLADRQPVAHVMCLELETG